MITEVLSGFNTFPVQRCSAAEKAKPSWYANSIDYVIAAGIGANDRTDTDLKLSILRGDIPNSFYKKTLNPYNASKEKYTRFPATMRNFDIMSDIIRRYVSEYYKGIHEFTVGANNPEVVLAKNAKLKQEVSRLCEQAFMQEFEKNLQQLVQDAEANGQPAESVNPQDAMPDMEAFVENFNKNYIDDRSKQGQDVLDYIKSATKDTILYLTAMFNWCALGECYTYSDVRGEKIVKECVPVNEAYPVPNANYLVEDFDMFARKMMMSYQQIIDTFDDVLDEKDRKYLEDFYAQSKNATAAPILLRYDQFFERYPDYCEKFTKEERELFKKEPIRIHDSNTSLYEVWHVVWRGEACRGILTRVNEIGLEEQMVVEEDYVFNPEAGDINIEWKYEPQVYEGYRIGGRNYGIYPIKARPIAYQRNGKLPYNGIMEVLPLMGKFSIIKLITPFQIMRNIFIYHREMVIAKNKMLILLMPQSLIADDEEDKIYKMAADGILLADDEDDAAGTKMQQVRMLNAQMGDYITQLTNLIESIKMEAREMVDMNMQRYGDIAQSSGVGTTQEAIARSSMGSVIIFQMFDEMRRADYDRDIDFGKLAFIDGLQTTFIDDQRRRRTLSLDVNSFINSDYSTTVRNEQKELDKLRQLKDWAFSAAQNGDLEAAISAITGDNVAAIKANVEKYMEIKRQHEEAMQQMEQQLKQEEIQAKIQEIQAQGEVDARLMELKYAYEMQLKYIDVDMSMLTQTPDDSNLKARLAQEAEANKTNLAQQKLELERQKFQGDMYNAAAEREVKREQMDNQLKIAKTNKNKYDKA